MNISIAALFGWVAAALVPVGGLGLAVSWAFAGPPTGDAALTAAAIVLPLMGVSAVLTVYAAGRGAAWAAFAFASVGIVRMVATFGLSALALWAGAVQTGLLIPWVMGLYFLVLAAECIWLARALNHDAYRQALGEFAPAGEAG